MRYRQGTFWQNFAAGFLMAMIYDLIGGRHGRHHGHVNHNHNHRR